ncbi:DUF4136 domain-containing protein [Coraliomargarita akajimensis]|uniref:DUF4136 domain-containing protein n=1 Tax=Coraliomargarita akajimensis TaxID=395922 RepID=UPI00031012D7|nr:DUF4136 domain-containing protein [Coraliomargarita akajimensis]
MSHDYESGTDFSQLKQYCWEQSEQSGTGNVRLDNDLMDARIRDSIESEFAAKGYQLVELEHADFTVSYTRDLQQRIGSSGGGSSISFGVGGSRSSSSRRSSVGLGYSTGGQPSSYDESLFAIDVRLAQSQQLIWRGTATQRASGNLKPEELTKRVRDTVRRVLEQFPPEVP